MKRKRAKADQLPLRYRCRDKYNRALEKSMSRVARPESSSDEENEASAGQVNTAKTNTSDRLEWMPIELASKSDFFLCCLSLQVILSQENVKNPVGCQLIGINDIAAQIQLNNTNKEVENS